MITLRSTAEIALATPADVVARMCDHFAEHDLAARRDGQSWHVRFPAGEARIDVGRASATILAEAPDIAGLCTIRLALASHLMEFADGGCPSIVWTGHATGIVEPPNFRRMTVLRNVALTRSMRRITLTGHELARYDSFDLHVKLLLPGPSRAAPLWPTLGPDGLMRWPNGDDRLAVRIYTIRRIDVARGELDIDMVVHDGAAGPGSDFAASARPGDVVGMIGPGGRNVGQADWHLLAGDETALPAISRILEQLPASARGLALIETGDPAERPPVRPHPGFEIRWLPRGSGAAGPLSPLGDEIRRVELPTDGSVFCWAGAEFAAFKAIRAHWRDTAGLDRRRQLAVAYWRHGSSQGATTNER
jgi:NADPH-dependent ferric siderophore reductase